MSKLPLHFKIILGLVLGIVYALVSSSLGLSWFTMDWIAPFGTIFIKLLKLIAVPLVLFSIIKGVSSMSDISRLGRVGFKTLGIYLITTVFAVTIGLSFVNLIKPGTLIEDSQRVINRINYELWLQDNPDVIRVDKLSYLNDPQYKHLKEQALVSHAQRESAADNKIQQATSTKDGGPLKFLVDMVPGNIFFSLSSNGLMLQVIFFAIFFGITMLFISKEKAAPVIGFVDGINEIFLKMVEIIMRAAPFFVFALLAGTLAEMAGDNPHNMIEIFKGLGWYSITVLGGLFVLAFGVYPLIVSLFVKGLSVKNFLRGMSPAQLLAFSTSSSVATLPVTMECVRDNLGVSKEVTSFVLPIGATVNMDGTSLYQAIAVVFIAQFHLIDLTLTQQLIIILTATLASIGSAAVPSAGLIMMIIVLQSVGLNPAWIAIIFPVDRILDMCRTVVNVTGDATVASVIASSEGALDAEIAKAPNQV